MEENEKRDCLCGDNNMVMENSKAERNDCERKEMLMQIRELKYTSRRSKSIVFTQKIYKRTKRTNG